MSAQAAPAPPAEPTQPPPAFVEDDSKPPLTDLLVRRARRRTHPRELSRLSQLTDDDAQAAEAVLLRPPGCLPAAAAPR